MLQIWVEKGMFQVTEQRLVDQANQIRYKQCLSELELDEIGRLIEGEYTGEVGGSEEDQEMDSSEQEEVRTDPQLDKTKEFLNLVVRALNLTVSLNYLFDKIIEYPSNTKYIQYTCKLSTL